MKSSAFTFWEAPAEQPLVTWEEAHRRLADQARADATSSPGPA
jgi:hypothetical protein